MKRYLLLIMAVFFLCAEEIYATIWNLTDGNSSIFISDDTFNGVFIWTVDGVSQMNGLSLWYRAGSSGGESPIGVGNLTLTSASMANPNELDTSYSAVAPQPYTVDVSYKLTGGLAGSIESQFDVDLTISNTGTNSLELHLFEYINFKLNNTATNDSSQILGSTLALQIDNSTVATTSVDLPFDHFEVADFNDILFGELLDGSPSTFNDVSGPLGPGSLAAGLQWDLMIGAGESVSFSQVQTIKVIPEPSTMVLMMIAGLSCCMRRLRFHMMSV